MAPGHLGLQDGEQLVGRGQGAHQVGEIGDRVTDGVAVALEVEVHSKVVTRLELGGPHGQVEEVAGSTLGAVSFGSHLPRGLAVGRQPWLVRPHLQHRGHGGTWSPGRGVDMGRGQHGGLGHHRGLGCPGLPDPCCPGSWSMAIISSVNVIISATLDVLATLVNSTNLVPLTLPLLALGYPEQHGPSHPLDLGHPGSWLLVNHSDPGCRPPWTTWPLRTSPPVSLTLSILVFDHPRCLGQPNCVGRHGCPDTSHPAPWPMVTRIALVLGHSGHLEHHSHLSHACLPDLGHPSRWSPVKRVALTLVHHGCVGHLILLSWSLVNGDHAGHGPWSPWTSQPPWLSQQPQPPGHFNHPCPLPPWPPQFQGHPGVHPHSQ